MRRPLDRIRFSNRRPKKIAAGIAPTTMLKLNTQPSGGT
jgi:hypothetical protein